MSTLVIAELEDPIYTGIDYKRHWTYYSHPKVPEVIKLTLGPVVVAGGSEANVFSMRQRLILGPKVHIRYGYLFLGCDNGDICEGPGFEIQDRYGIPLARPRSPHKEAPTHYEAYEELNFKRFATEQIWLVTKHRTTGWNNQGGGPPKLSSRAHWGLWLYLQLPKKDDWSMKW